MGITFSRPQKVSDVGTNVAQPQRPLSPSYLVIRKKKKSKRNPKDATKTSKSKGLNAQTSSIVLESLPSHRSDISTRSGANLNLLPVELLYEITCHIPRKADLSNLCLTSRRLHEVTAALLYDSYNFEGSRKFYFHHVLSLVDTLQRHDAQDLQKVMKKMKIRTEPGIDLRISSFPMEAFETLLVRASLIPTTLMYSSLRADLHAGQIDAATAILLLCCPYVTKIELQAIPPHDHQNRGNGSAVYKLFIAAGDPTHSGTFHSFPFLTELTFNFSAIHHECPRDNQQYWCTCGLPFYFPVRIFRIPSLRKVRIFDAQFPDYYGRVLPFHDAPFTSNITELEYHGQIAPVDLELMADCLSNLRTLRLCFTGSYSLSRGQPREYFPALRKLSATLEGLEFRSEGEIISTRPVGSFKDFRKLRMLSVTQALLVGQYDGSHPWLGCGVLKAVEFLCGVLPQSLRVLNLSVAIGAAVGELKPTLWQDIWAQAVARGHFRELKRVVFVPFQEENDGEDDHGDMTAKIIWSRNAAEIAWEG